MTLIVVNRDGSLKVCSVAPLSNIIHAERAELTQAGVVRFEFRFIPLVLTRSLGFLDCEMQANLDYPVFLTVSYLPVVCLPYKKVSGTLRVLSFIVV